MPLRRIAKRRALALASEWAVGRDARDAVASRQWQTLGSAELGRVREISIERRFAESGGSGGSGGGVYELDLFKLKENA